MITQNKILLFKRCILFLFFLGITMQSFSQTRTLTGKVLSSADGKPLMGATVEINGVKNSTVKTDQAGNFSLSVTGIVTLKVTYVGYATQSKRIEANTSNVVFSLEEESVTLQEAVVTGYTSQKKQDITGAVTVVKVSDLNTQTNSSIQQGLQGLAAGVSVTSSGVPGGEPTVLIRGIQSLSLNNAPLYVIDGVPTNSLQDVNQNDIENIQVLKDAASSAQYGARASNGVILVTTKKGSKGTPLKVTYDYYYGVQQKGKGYSLLTPQEDANLLWLVNKNIGATPTSAQYGSGATPVLPDILFAGGAGVSGVRSTDPAADPKLYNYPNYFIIPANKTGTNWYDEVFRDAPQQNHNLSLVSGGQNSKVYLGLNYFKQDGIILHTYYDRFTVRINSEFNIKNVVRVGENVSLSYASSNGISNQEEQSVVNTVNRIKTIIPVYDLGGNFAGNRGAETGQARNPVAQLTWAKDNHAGNYKILGNLYLEADIIKPLTFRTSFGGEQKFSNWYRFNYATYEDAENVPSNSYTEGYSSSRSWTWTNTLTYKQVFAEKHNFLALAGTEAIESWGRYIEGSRVNYYVNEPNYRAINTGNPPSSVNGAPDQLGRLFSLFGKLTYNYDSRYYFDGTIRRDGSNVFSTDFQYAVFPSFSVGWAIHNEEFLQNVKELSNLKLRLGWGQVGNQSIPPLNPYFTYSSSLGRSSYDWSGTNNSVITGFYNNQIGNPKGKWETNTNTNIGLDLGLFQGKLNLNIDYYQNKITDLLYQAPLNSVTQGNANAPYLNIGSMQNTGLDLSINYRDQTKSGFKYSITTNITTYKNEILYLADNVPYFEAGGSRIGNFVRNQVGNPISSFFGYKVVGIYQDIAEVTKYPQIDAGVGRFRYADVNGFDANGNLTGKADGKVDQADRTFIGNPNPGFTYGFNINLAYKGFDLSLFFYGVQGKDILNYQLWWIDYFSSFVGSKSKDALYNSWLPDRKNARLPIAEPTANFSNSGVLNSSFIEDGSYFRLKNFIFGYTIPNKILAKSGIEKIRIYVQATNLFTITKYTGLDPEFVGQNVSGTSTASTTAFGIDYGNYPAPQLFTIGLNVGF